MQMTSLFHRLSRLVGATSLACLAVSAPGAASADVFELASGGRVVGDLLNEKELPRQTYDVKTPIGIVVSLDRAAVKHVEKQRPALEEYAEIKPTYPDTVDGQWELAEWCREHHLYTQRNEALEHVVKLDGNHLESRRILGYVKIDGQWVAPDDAMLARGYVSYKGRWRLPQEIATIESRVKQEKSEREWFKKIEQWKVAWLTKGSREDYERIRNIDDPMALRALQQKLRLETDRDMRVLFLEAINGIGGPGADDILAKVSLYDADPEVRLSALDYLEKSKPPEVVFVYMKALRDKDPIIINRAGAYLGALEAQSSVPSLIESLVTAHKFQVTYGAPSSGSGMGVGASFAKPGSAGSHSASGAGGGFGGGGLSMGSQTVIETHYSRNEYVLNSLVSLTKQNFGYDVAAWKAWLASQDDARLARLEAAATIRNRPAMSAAKETRMRSVCVFCASSLGADPSYREAAAAMGRELAARGWRLVYGGGKVGLMGVVADAALQAGGDVLGVIPQALVDRELAHRGLTELVIVRSMHERKARMAEAADAFVALPGGFGTFEEFCEVLTWTQLGLQSKPCGLLNVNGFYDPLLALFDRATADRFLKPEHRASVLTSATAPGILDALLTWRPTGVEK